jgi:hypothetical protein
MHRTQSKRAPGRRGAGSLAGLAGGVAGLVAMRYVMKTASRFVPESKERGFGSAPRHDVSVIGRHHHEGEASTAAIGRMAYTRVTGREPDDDTKARLSNGVHWLYGLAMAALYGALRGARPAPMRRDLATGAAFGALLWMLGDEVMVPLLGLAEGPRATPLQGHAQALAGHLGYGLVTGAGYGAARRAVRM